MNCEWRSLNKTLAALETRPDRYHDEWHSRQAGPNLQRAKLHPLCPVDLPKGTFVLSYLNIFLIINNWIGKFHIKHSVVCERSAFDAQCEQASFSSSVFLRLKRPEILTGNYWVHLTKHPLEFWHSKGGEKDRRNSQKYSNNSKRHGPWKERINKIMKFFKYWI